MGGDKVGPTGQGIWHMASSCQVHSRGDNYFGKIPHVLIIY
jgi:hypothetical protein